MAERKTRTTAARQKGIDVAGLNALAAQRAKKWLEDDELIPRDLKSLTGALKDISDIARTGSEGGAPPVIVIAGLNDDDQHR
ncbi:MAG: hypothetical protein LBR76_01680 [Oscillospiraceae bacterium]|nr:hypothetical protein [Oscillospiraceae bacterium]